MERDQIHSATAQERRRIADLRGNLDEAQLATPGQPGWAWAIGLATVVVMPVQLWAHRRYRLEGRLRLPFGYTFRWRTEPPE